MVIPQDRITDVKFLEEIIDDPGGMPFLYQHPKVMPGNWAGRGSAELLTAGGRYIMG